MPRSFVPDTVEIYVIEWGIIIVECYRYKYKIVIKEMFQEANRQVFDHWTS